MVASQISKKRFEGCSVVLSFTLHSRPKKPRVCSKLTVKCTKDFFFSSFKTLEYVVEVLQFPFADRRSRLLWAASKLKKNMLFCRTFTLRVPLFADKCSMVQYLSRCSIYNYKFVVFTYKNFDNCFK